MVRISRWKNKKGMALMTLSLHHSTAALCFYFTSRLESRNEVSFEFKYLYEASSFFSVSFKKAAHNISALCHWIWPQPSLGCLFHIKMWWKMSFCLWKLLFIRHVFSPGFDCNVLFLSCENGRQYSQNSQLRLGCAPNLFYHCKKYIMCIICIVSVV